MPFYLIAIVGKAPPIPLKYGERLDERLRRERAHEPSLGIRSTPVLYSEKTFKITGTSGEVPLPSLSAALYAKSDRVLIVSQFGTVVGEITFSGEKTQAHYVKPDGAVTTIEVKGLLGMPLITAKQVQGGGAGSVPYVVFRPGLPSSGVFLSTWAEVKAAVQTGLKDLFIDDSLAAAETDASVTDFKYVQSIGRYKREAGAGDAVLKIVAGGVIKNVRNVFGVTLSCESTAGASLTWDDETTSPVLALGEGAGIRMTNNATQSAIQLGLNEGVVIGLSQGGFLNADLAPANTCVVDLQDATSQLLTPTLDFGIVGIDTVKGVVGSTWNLPYSDSMSIALPWSEPNFAGTLNFLRISKSVLLEPAFGTTAGRPNFGNGPAQPANGMMYFDTDIGFPVWWNGTDWVNSDGVVSLRFRGSAVRN